ncbi:MAG: helix-turn-helix transcriptional regulator, partial [Myxococcales bacterium]
TARVLSGLGTPPPELLGHFEQAFGEACCLAFDYRDRHGRTSRRTVEPHGLLVEPPVWYVLARDVERDAARMFRMDRIARPRLVRERRFTPDLEGLHRQLQRERGEAQAGG